MARVLSLVVLLAACALVAGQGDNRLAMPPGLPRHVKPLGFAKFEDTLTSMRKQAYCTLDSYDQESVKIEVHGLSGQCKGEVTVLTKEMADWNKEFVLAKNKPLSFAGKASVPYIGNFNAPKQLKNHRLCVVVECGNFIQSITFSIRARRPDQDKVVPVVRSSEGPVCGLADLHLHQFASLGFGGNWFEESYEGPFKDPEEEKLGFVTTGIHGHQQIHEKWLKKAHAEGLRLAIVPAVNNDFICFGATKYPCDDQTSAIRQIVAAHAFAKKNAAWYEIALDPWHARRIIKAGKLAVILAIEISDLFPKDRGNWEDQFDEVYGLGVRSILAVHEIDNRFAGAAPHMQIIEWLQIVHHGHNFKLDPTGIHNLQGLTDEGKALLQKMMSKKMLIDLAHLSRASWRDVVGLTSSNNYPLYDSHTRFEAVLDDKHKQEVREFVTDDEKLDIIKQRRGVAGLRTSSELINPFVPPADSTVQAVDDTCEGSSTTFAQSIQYGTYKGINLAFGSDLNGFAGQVGPRFGKFACPNPRGKTRVDRLKRREQQVAQQKTGLGTEFDTKGDAHVGLLPDLVRDLKLIKADTTSLERSAENVLRMWERAWPDDQHKNLDKPYATDCKFFQVGEGTQVASLSANEVDESHMLDAETDESDSMKGIMTSMNEKGDTLDKQLSEVNEDTSRIV